MRELIEDLNNLMERQRGPAAGDFSDESSYRPGAFKIGSDFSTWAKKELGGKLEDVLFKRQRDAINAIPRNDLPRIWGKDNIADAQDVIAGKPKKAFQMWMKNVHKVDPRLGKLIRAVPENASLLFYAFMVRVSGRDMADIIMRRWFTSGTEYKKRKTPKKGTKAGPAWVRRNR